MFAWCVFDTSRYLLWYCEVELHIPPLWHWAALQKLQNRAWSNSDCSEVPPFSLNNLELKLCFRKVEEIWNVVFLRCFLLLFGNFKLRIWCGPSVGSVLHSWGITGIRKWLQRLEQYHAMEFWVTRVFPEHSRSWTQRENPDPKIKTSLPELNIFHSQMKVVVSNSMETQLIFHKWPGEEIPVWMSHHFCTNINFGW